jgi:23S rRNA pseudouridine1911/1915/1917 synthase
VKEIELTCDSGETERLDAFVARSVTDLTRSAAQRLIESGMVTVDGQAEKPAFKLKGNERVLVRIPPPVAATPAAENIPLDILHEDSDLVVINKPRGMTVHPGAGTPHGTLVNALLGHCTDLSGIGGELRPGIVHRIDKDTTGVIVVAKNDRSHEHLSRQFREHSVKRVYVALVFGSPKQDKGRIESVIGRHPVDRKKMSGKARHGKHAVTHWRAVARFPGMTLMELRLETGRTHQIRVHLSEAGYPLVGDPVYCGAGKTAAIADLQLRQLVKDLERQALHARTLGFVHPATSQYMEFDTSLPEDMQRIIDYLHTTVQSQPN